MGGDWPAEAWPPGSGPRSGPAAVAPSTPASRSNRSTRDASPEAPGSASGMAARTRASSKLSRGRRGPAHVRLGRHQQRQHPYTRPADFRGWQVPEVLVSGNHEEIRRWRRRTALEKTWRNRPDLLDRAALGDEDKQLLARITGKEDCNASQRFLELKGQDHDQPDHRKTSGQDQAHRHSCSSCRATACGST